MKFCKGLRFIILFISLLLSFASNAQRMDALNQTPTYKELMDTLQSFSHDHEWLELYAMGPSDYGLPIHLCVVNGAGDSLQTFAKAQTETTVLFNNAIHPGEPDGINATIIWLNELKENPTLLKSLPLVAIIPAYNIGGMHNRSSTSRANQNGPLEYGFRGNAQNLDLNRDFIKMDSQNAFTFSTIFHALDPDVFVDNHVSNGANYQYTLTYIAPVRERIPPALRSLMYNHLIPELSTTIKKNHGYDLFPYVDLKGRTPSEGIISFNDLPRYSMGYTSLFNTISFTVETHMLKPFDSRVDATYAFMKEIINWSYKNSKRIEKSREEAYQFDLNQKSFYYNYRLSNKKDSILFKGYAHSFPINKYTNQPRLLYDEEDPYEHYIPWYKYYDYKDSLQVPKYYIVGGQEGDVTRRLEVNNIKYRRVLKDTVMTLGTYFIKDYKVFNTPYEGHFRLFDSRALQSLKMVPLKRGDLIISTRQKGCRFIHSVLHPECEDSYFSWNFFDSYLQQKEYFSSYVFVEKIEEILLNDQTLMDEFNEKKRLDEGFRNSEREQLNFIYERSNYFEKNTYKVLPVFYEP